MNRRFAATDIVAEVMLVVVTVTAVLGFDRMFDDSGFRGPLITTAVVTHAVLFLTRQLRGGVLLALLTSAVALVLQITWSLFPATGQLIIPTRDTLTAASDELSAAWDLFNTVQAPAPSATGFVLAASVAVWAVAFLADWAAFRLRTAGEALLPTTATIIFIALIGVPDGRFRHVAFYMGAAILFLLAHRAASRVSSGVWLGDKIGTAYGSLMLGGGVIACVALVAGLLGGPALPGAEEEPLIDWRQVGDSGPSSRVAISPLIDIRSRLVNQPDVEAFTVETDSPGYWRTMALDNFNGTTWTLAADFSVADGELKNFFETDVPSETVIQDFTITGLDMDWLPAAYRPAVVDAPGGQKITYEASLSTLIVDETADITNMTYRIESARPIVTPDLLIGAPASDIDARYTELPADFDPAIRALAEEVTREATDDYGKALALQNFFRVNGGFTYSLAVNPGHDERAIQAFLENRVGYCEQFAGTFGAMARSIGLPTRIAVGFTDGEPDPDNPRLYRVRGKNAHSWPEVYIEGAGWLHFEPTPGRGAAETAAYTGIAQQQVGEVAEAIQEGAVSIPNPTAGPGDASIQVEQPPTTQPRSDGAQSFEDALSEEEQARLDAQRAGKGGRNWAIAGLVALAVAGYAVAVPLLKRRKRQHERSVAADQRERVRVAWEHASADMSLRGVARKASETDQEYAKRAARELRMDQISVLGGHATVAAFAPEFPDSDVADEAEALEDQIQAELASRTSFVDKSLDGLDPRPLLTRR